MNLIPRPNQQAKGYRTLQIDLGKEESKVWIEDTGIGSVPPGYRAFVRVDGFTIHLGIAPEGAPVVEEGDRYGTMSKADLQQACARKKIKYDAGDNETALKAKLREMK